MQDIKQIQENELDSFAKFIKEWRNNQISNVDGYKEILATLNMTEDIDLDYNKLPVQISFIKMPIITGGIANVKVVLIVQADNFALIIPENVYDSYEVIEDNSAEIQSINLGLQLSIDSAGFDSSDVDYQNMVKRAYITADNSSPAFELLGVAKVNADNKVEDEESGIGSPADKLGEIGSMDKSPEPVFEEPSGLEFDDEIAKNQEAYSKFSKDTNSLEKLLEKLKAAPTVISDNVKAKYIGESKNLLMLLVDNKSVYKSFINIPRKAKETISKFGETIRLNADTQIIDTFLVSGNRAFIVAEYVANNYWLVEGEENSNEELSGKKIIPKRLIKLTKSSVREESRKFKPTTYNGKIAFSLNK